MSACALVGSSVPQQDVCFFRVTTTAHPPLTTDGPGRSPHPAQRSGDTAARRPARPSPSRARPCPWRRRRAGALFLSEASRDPSVGARPEFCTHCVACLPHPQPQPQAWDVLEIWGNFWETFFPKNSETPDKFSRQISKKPATSSRGPPPSPSVWQGLAKQWNNLKYALISMFCMVLPVFSANFPGAPGQWLWIAAAAVALGGFGVFLYFMYLRDILLDWGNVSVYLQTSCAYLLVTYGIVCVAFVAFCVEVARSARSAAVLHRLWGIRKAREAYGYAKWIATVHRGLAPEERAALERTADCDPLAIMHVPPAEYKRCIWPLRFVVVMGLVVWLFGLFLLLVIRAYVAINDSINRVANLVPPVPAGAPAVT